MGLDLCTAAQRWLRTLLALGMFNHGPTSLWPRHVSLADITRYTLVVSPRYDDLVITAQAPYNVVCWLVGRDRLPIIGLPGLRVESSYEEGWRLRHLPTGAIGHPTDSGWLLHYGHTCLTARPRATGPEAPVARDKARPRLPPSRRAPACAARCRRGGWRHE